MSNRRWFVCQVVGIAAVLSSANGLTAAEPTIASFSVAQHSAEGRVGLRFTLTNRSASRLWVNRRMAAEEDSCLQQVGEIRLRVLDARGRTVPFGCAKRALGAQDRDYGILQPGEKATSEFNLVEECYSVEPGEILMVRAYYVDVNPTPPPPPAGASALGIRLDADPVTVKIPARPKNGPKRGPR